MFYYKKNVFKYHKVNKIYMIIYFEKSLRQFRDISHENKPSKFHKSIYNRLYFIMLTKKGDTHAHPGNC